VKEVRWTLVH